MNKQKLYDKTLSKKNFCLMKCSSENLINLAYLWNTKIHVGFFRFHFVLLFH